DTGGQIDRLCVSERVAVCDLAGQSVFRVMLIRTAFDRFRLVLTVHHIVLDGWSMPILLGEVFGSYRGQRLQAVAPYRRFVSWLAGRDRGVAAAVWREVLAGFDAPTLVGRAQSVGSGRRGSRSFRVDEHITGGVNELARSCRITVN